MQAWARSAFPGGLPEQLATSAVVAMREGTNQARRFIGIPFLPDPDECLRLVRHENLAVAAGPCQTLNGPENLDSIGKIDG
jgi:hypothetical protein